MEKINHDNVAEFNTEMVSGVVCIKVGAKSCGPCRQYDTVITGIEVDDRFSGVRFVSVDVGVSPSIATDMGVVHMPLTVILKDGIRQFTKSGVIMPSELIEVLSGIIHE